MLSGENGLLKRAGDARDNTVVGQEKEQVELAYSSAVVKKSGDSVTVSELQSELDSSVGQSKTTVTDNGDNTLNVYFIDTKHNYIINNGQVSKIDDSYRSSIKEAYVENNELYILKTNGEFVKSGHANPTNERRVWNI